MAPQADPIENARLAAVLESALDADEAEEAAAAATGAPWPARGTSIDACRHPAARRLPVVLFGGGLPCLCGLSW